MTGKNMHEKPRVLGQNLYSVMNEESANHRTVYVSMSDGIVSAIFDKQGTNYFAYDSCVGRVCNCLLGWNVRLLCHAAGKNNP